MAKAKAIGRKGIDSWTSNGYGITVEKDNKKELNEKIRKLSKNDDINVIVKKSKE